MQRIFLTLATATAFTVASAATVLAADMAPMVYKGPPAPVLASWTGFYVGAHIGAAWFGLLLTILGCAARNAAAIPYAVGLYITAAYWFTASTSFANPAVTIARSLSDTFAGIAPGGVVAFIAAQLAGMLAAVLLAHWFWTSTKSASI